MQGEAAPGTRLTLDGRPVRVAADGVFVFGFGREAGPIAKLTIEHPDGRREERELAIAKRRFQVQRIDGLPSNMVNPDPAELARIKDEGQLIAAARAKDSQATDFRNGFRWPVLGPISGVYGSQRVLNGEPRRPHFGVDVAAPVGTAIRAPAPGLVVVAERDLFFTGGTVMLDHGHGVTSVYSHLDTVTAVVGAAVQQGDVIGTLGGTGRITGPHLDWRISWFEIPLDPMLIAGPMPSE